MFGDAAIAAYLWHALFFMNFSTALLIFFRLLNLQNSKYRVYTSANPTMAITKNTTDTNIVRNKQTPENAAGNHIAINVLITTPCPLGLLFFHDCIPFASFRNDSPRTSGT